MKNGIATDLVKKGIFFLFIDMCESEYDQETTQIFQRKIQTSCVRIRDRYVCTKDQYFGDLFVDNLCESYNRCEICKSDI